MQPGVRYGRVVIGLLIFALGVGLFSSVLSAEEATGEKQPEKVDVFRKGEGGYHTYRIPALIATEKGTVLAFCEGRKRSRSDHGDIDLVLKRSSDGGRTWGPLQIVHEEGGTEKVTIGNPCPVVDKTTGRIWLPFTRDNDDVFVTFSKDEGKTWAEPRKITEDVKKPNWGWYATGPGTGIQIERGRYAGRLVIPCDHRVKGKGERRESTRSHVIYSDDGGKSWQLGGWTDFLMNECAVVELTDGSLMLNMRSNRGKGKRGVAISKDGGSTWSEARDDPTLIEPVCQGSLIRYSGLSEGEKSRLLFSNPASKKSRERLTVRLSYDEGKTWPVQRLIEKGSAAYSSLARLKDGRIGVLYERENYAKITLVRFSLKWLTGGNDAASSE